MKFSVRVLTAMLFCLTLSNAFAEDTDIIQKLEQAIAKQQVQLEEQQQQLRELQKAKAIAQDVPKASMSYGRPTIATADSRNTLSVRALVQADSAHYAQVSAGPLSNDYRRGSTGASTAASPNRENTAARDLSDGTYFRRARLGIEGTFNRDINYNLTLELGGAGTEAAGKITNAWLSYGGFAPFTIQAGAYAPNAGLDDATAPEDALFIERASPADIARAMGAADGRMALSIRGAGVRWMSALSLTGRTVGDAEVYDTQQALVGRVVGLVATSSDYNVHLGAAGTYIIHPADAQGGSDNSFARYQVRLRNQPELRVDSTRLIDTGNLDAGHAYNASAELAANWRNFFLQGENFWYGVKRRNADLSEARFNGYYLEASWLITGESRRYNMNNGSFQNPRPYVNVSSQGGLGAWELAMRFSSTDLNYHAGALGTTKSAEGVRGGRQDIFTAGVNWYLNPNVKLVLNYLYVKVDRLSAAGTTFGDNTAIAGSTPPAGVQIGQKLNTYALRIQYSL